MMSDGFITTLESNESVEGDTDEDGVDEEALRCSREELLADEGGIEVPEESTDGHR